MTRLLVPLTIADTSAFGKSLKRLLDERHALGKAPPSHVELLNLLSRAAGWRNFQTLKAAALEQASRAATAVAPPTDLRLAPARNEPVNLSELTPTVRKTLLQFDGIGRLIRLPNKLSVQQMACWALWTQFEAKRKYTEKQVNAVLNAHHSFGDPATLRRELVNMKLLGRLSDCSQYWKEAQRPSDEVQGFLRAWRAGMR